MRVCLLCSTNKTWIQIRNGKEREHWYRYENGHICISCYKKVKGLNHKRWLAHKFINSKTVLCRCGCKQEIKEYDKYGRKHEYINGHQPKNTSKLIPFQKGENHIGWKGGRTKHTNGYILVYKPDHPFAHKGYVYEHRIVYEEHYNCCVLPWIDVHHINGNKIDNRIENLITITRSEHISQHMIQRHSRSSCAVA